MKGIEKYTDEELNKVFDAAVTIKEIMQKYEEWKTLVDESDIYRECLYKGTRRIKLLDSREIRTVRDVCIFEINGMEVFL